MLFVYPVRLGPDEGGQVAVTCRDLPEVITSGADRAEALAMAADALEVAIGGRLIDAEDIPVPSKPKRNEVLVAVPLRTAAKAVLHSLVAASGLTQVALAERLGVAPREVRRLLDPRYRSDIAKLEDAIAAAGGPLPALTADLPAATAVAARPRLGRPPKAAAGKGSKAA